MGGEIIHNAEHRKEYLGIIGLEIHRHTQDRNRHIEHVQKLCNYIAVYSSLGNFRIDRAREDDHTFSSDEYALRTHAPPPPVCVRPKRKGKGNEPYISNRSSVQLKQGLGTVRQKHKNDKKKNPPCHDALQRSFNDVVLHVSPGCRSAGTGKVTEVGTAASSNPTRRGTSNAYEGDNLPCPPFPPNQIRIETPAAHERQLTTACPTHDEPETAENPTPPRAP